jgi:hypothetical protein
MGQRTLGRRVKQACMVLQTDDSSMTNVLSRASSVQ